MLACSFSPLWTNSMSRNLLSLNRQRQRQLAPSRGSALDIALSTTQHWAICGSDPFWMLSSNQPWLNHPRSSCFHDFSINFFVHRLWCSNCFLPAPRWQVVRCVLFVSFQWTSWVTPAFLDPWSLSGHLQFSQSSFPTYYPQVSWSLCCCFPLNSA